MKSLMNRYVKLLSFLPGICLIVACTGHQIKGYEINGSAPLPEFEGKMVYMKDASSGQPIDSAEIIHGKFAFADTVTIVSPVVKVLSIRASKSGLEYRLPVVIENGSIQADISDVVCTLKTLCRIAFPRPGRRNICRRTDSGQTAHSAARKRICLSGICS